MKKLHFIALAITGALSAPIIANEFPVCKSDLTKQMKRFEKTDFSVPRKVPTGNLKEYALQMEILCPWQVEIDLNGDKQLDWVGVIHRNDQFELVAYLSASRKYQLQVLHIYPFFPEQSYLRKLHNKKQSIKSKIKYSLAEITLNDNSREYTWRKGKLVVSRSYLDETIIPKPEIDFTEKFSKKIKKAN